jgi:hypothetical protein
MAASYLKRVDEVSDQALSALKKAEDAVIQAVSQASDFVAGIIPDLPENPLAEQIPTPRETAKTAFGVAEKFLAHARQYSLELLKALEPVTSKVFWNARKARKGQAGTKAA